MTKTDSQALLSKLKSSLPTPKMIKAEPLPPLPVPPPAVPAEQKSPKAKIKPPAQGEGDHTRATKASVSLYRTDLVRLDEIKEFMRKEGYRNLSDSDALQLACRAVKIGPEFLEHYQQMQKEDGRRRTAAK